MYPDTTYFSGPQPSYTSEPPGQTVKHSNTWDPPQSTESESLEVRQTIRNFKSSPDDFNIYTQS